MSNDDATREASLRRKLAAMEASGGDPVKIAEFRAQLPVERKPAPKVTAEAQKPAKAVDDGKLGDPVTEGASAPRKPGRPRMAASRGMDTTK